MSITKNELTMGRDKQFPEEYTKEISDNLDKLLISMNKIRTAYNKSMQVSSGWRPVAVNAKIAGAAKKSNHTLGLACDVKDSDGSLWAWCLENLQLIKDCGLYLEDKRWSKTWVHFQNKAPASKKRIFRAYAGDPPNPEMWDGIYDSKFDG